MPTPVIQSRRTVAAWLLVCCALVFVMVVVGGITRLTHSGLSIVEWQPVMGAVPPLNEAQWAETFAKYQQTPEFKQRNHDMTVGEFKGIFWWEYSHRLLGRVIGLVFLIPFLFFLFRGRLDPEVAWMCGGIFVLGALQGVVGWLMVASGLVDEPRVSSIRLATHLGLAFLIYGFMLWVALDLLFRERGLASDTMRGRASGMLAIIWLMVLSGALVAGIKAGYAYNTWPLMNGKVVPDEILLIEPWYANIAYNMATVQFIHRCLALVIALMAVGLWFDVRREPPNPRPRFWSTILLLMAFVQVGLGISTLLLRVPVNLAAMHQMGALVLFSIAIMFRHTLREQKQFQM
ncbi:MAG TPA: COX15/CtaA family protein [Usitatibacter sp.]|nr:COX15/CtaA family protein [Usitatibacter sp.]